jgi:hypothetical protein
VKFNSSIELELELTKEANGPKVIHQRMIIVYGNEGPSLFQIRFWSEQFRWGLDSTQDDPKSGRPVEARTGHDF